MKSYKKRDFDVSKTRRFLEPGPIVLVSSEWKGEQDIMTMGWHTLLEFTPALVGCMITSENHSYELIRKSKCCVINIPTYDLIDTVVGIGNCSGRDVDKFKEFGLTSLKAKTVKAPLIKECYANFECKLHDSRMLNKYNFFIFKVTKAQVATTPKYPRTVHYRGDGIFMISGGQVNKVSKFKPQNL